MKRIFVNLKRFDVAKSLGGLCPFEKPGEWIEWLLQECIQFGLGVLENIELVFLLPESLIITAGRILESMPKAEVRSISIGCQGVYREDVQEGGSFGAFTANLPAAAARSMGCTWAMAGHSEKRREKLNMIAAYDPEVLTDEEKARIARQAVDESVNKEVLCALKRGMKVLLCIGESAAEKGGGDFEMQKPQIKKVLRTQLKIGLKGTEAFSPGLNITIGYEPVWAIGPGKTPPGREYIEFVSGFIKDYLKAEFGIAPAVVYGGGLKEENAGMVASIGPIDGGLVALTRFSGEIGFYPEELNNIIKGAFI